MTTGRCVDCGQTVSLVADKCVHCGRPYPTLSAKEMEEKKVENSPVIVVIKVVIVILVIGWFANMIPSAL